MAFYFCGQLSKRLLICLSACAGFRRINLQWASNGPVQTVSPKPNPWTLTWPLRQIRHPPPSSFLPRSPCSSPPKSAPPPISRAPSEATGGGGRCRRCGTRFRGGLIRSVHNRKFSGRRFSLCCNSNLYGMAPPSVEIRGLSCGLGGFFAGRRGRSLGFLRSTRTMSSGRKLTTARRKLSGYCFFSMPVSGA